MNTYTKKTKLSEKHVLFAISEKTRQEPIAIALLHLETNQIGCLLVDSAFRKQGFGTQLIKAIEKYAKENEIKTLQTITHPSNSEARAFFKKLGYEEWIKCYKVLKNDTSTC